MPKVSVILTSYNHEKYLREAVSSALDQTFGDFELIIWDDCSSDGSWEVIRSFDDARIVAYRNETNLGGGNVNRALKIGSGEYVAIHHSDDVWEPRKLEMQVAFLDAHPEIGAVFTNALAIGEDGEPFDDPDHFYSKVFDQPNRSRHQWLNHFFYHSNALCHPSVLVRRECYETCGPYRRGLAQLPDFDMWVRLCLRYEIHVMPEKLVRFRVRANEANSSGSRPETRIRTTTEAYVVLRNYLAVESAEEMFSIFPEAKAYGRDDGFEPGFVLAMVALQASAPPWAKPFAVDLLYGLMWDAGKMTELARIYDFTFTDLVQLTLKHDIFSLQRNLELSVLLNQSNNEVEHLNRVLNGRDTQIASLTQSIDNLKVQLQSLNDNQLVYQQEVQRLLQAASAKDDEQRAMSDVIARQSDQLAQAQSTLDDQQLQLTALEGNLTLAIESVAQKTEVISSLEIEVGSLLSRVDSLLNSWSWKVSKPLRIFGKLIGYGALLSRPDVQLHHQVAEQVQESEPATVLDSVRFNLEAISFEESAEGIVLLVTGWCFTIGSEEPVRLQVNPNDGSASVFSCDMRREDVKNAFPAEDVDGTSLPFCGFQHYVHLNRDVTAVSIETLHPRGVLHHQELVRIGKNQNWLLESSPSFHPSHLHALVDIYRKARGVVTWQNVFSLRNWGIWYKCALEELRWATVSSERKKSDFPQPISLSEAYVQNNQIKPHIRHLLKEAAAKFAYKPVISIIMPVYNVDAVFLEEAIASVQGQIYPHWELCIADDASTNAATIEVLKGVKDPRIKVAWRDTNGHICRASNDAAALATGDYVALVDNDDLLSPHALFEITRLLQKNPEADVIYSDEDKIDLEGNHFDLHFKPDWSPTLLLGYNYINHLTCIRRTLFESVGRFRPGYEGAQDYDLLLRVTEQTDKVFHISKILYHWRAIPGSTALKASEKPIVSTSAERILAEALARRGVAARIYSPEFARKLNVPVQQLDFSDDGPAVEIIIPTYNQGDVLKACLDSIRNKTVYRNYTIMVIDNGSQDAKTVRYLEELGASGIRVEKILNDADGFSFSRVNNIAVSRSSAEYVLFLNNDTEVIEPLWLSRLMGYVQLPGVGATGARLLYPNDTLQHAGVVLGMVGGFIPDHAFAKVPKDVPGYFFLPGTSRESSAVTGACLLTKKEMFVSLGGFDEEDFKISLNDVDYCLKVQDAGLSVVYVAGAELYHHESLTRSREDDPAELANFRAKYPDTKDPYYNPNLSRDCAFVVSQKCTLDYSEYFDAPLKVVFFTHNLNHEGAPKIMIRVMQGVKQSGVVAPIMISPSDGPARPVLEAEGFDVRVVNIRKEPNMLAPWASAADLEDAVVKVAELLQELKADVVVANVINSFFVVEAATRKSIPCLWWIHESYDENLLAANLQSLAFPLAEKAFALAARTIFVSKATQQLYERYNGRLNFSVINNSLDLSEWTNKQISSAVLEPRTRAGNKKVILSVGTVCDRKDQATIVTAAEALARTRDDFLVYLVGYRPELPYGDFVKRLIEEKNLQDVVILVPETKDVEQYYLSADLFVFSSLNESYSLTILEAMAYGLPIITTECCGVAEQVRFGVNAARIGFKDPAGLSEKIAFFLEDDDARSLYGRNSREMIRYMQTEQEMFSKHKELITAAYQTK